MNSVPADTSDDSDERARLSLSWVQAPPAVHHGPVLQEVGPEPAPVEVALDPELGLVQRLDAHEVARDEVELAPRLELRPRRRVALDLREGVEGAPLDPGARPGLAHGPGEPAPAVGDDHVGRRDRRHEGRPRPRVLGPGHVPGDRSTWNDMYKPRTQRRAHAPLAAARLMPLANALASNLEHLAFDRSEFAADALLKRRLEVVLSHQSLDTHP